MLTAPRYVCPSGRSDGRTVADGSPRPLVIVREVVGSALGYKLNFDTDHDDDRVGGAGMGRVTLSALVHRRSGDHGVGLVS